VLAAICIPTFPDASWSWLQGLRSRHDPKYVHLVAPHVTVVFPTTALPEDSFIAHVSSCLRGVNGTAVAFSSAREFHDQATGADLVYLVPSEGADWFHWLHEKLYSGPLAAERRLDIPYVPHVTVGRFASSRQAAKVATEVSSACSSITGRVQAVDVVHVADDLVRHVHREPLGAG
jgi:2'-5' RNA ligase